MIPKHIVRFSLLRPPQAISVTTARRRSRARAPPPRLRYSCDQRWRDASAAASGTECAAAWGPTWTRSSRREAGRGPRQPAWTASTGSPPPSACSTTSPPPPCPPAPRPLAAPARPIRWRGRRNDEGGGASAPPHLLHR